MLGACKVPNLWIILVRQASAKQAEDVQRLQNELEDALESRDREVRRADSDRREMARLQERIVTLETEQQASAYSVRHPGSSMCIA